MFKKVLLILIVCCLSGAIHAAPPAAAESKVDQLDYRAEIRAAAQQAASTVTEADVGDVESFGLNKIYLGVEQTLPILVDSDCSGFDPANGVCIEPNPAPANTAIDEFNLGTLELPGKATNSLLCFTFTQFSNWFWNNSTATTANARMSLRPTVQIANDVLIGLTDISGNPFNGTVFVDPAAITVLTLEHTLPAGAVEFQGHSVTRSCTGGLVSARSLRAQGLTDEQIKDFFKEPMTITFGMAGNVSLVEFGQFFVGVRLYGDE